MLNRDCCVCLASLGYILPHCVSSGTVSVYYCVRAHQYVLYMFEHVCVCVCVALCVCLCVSVHGQAVWERGDLQNRGMLCRAVRMTRWGRGLGSFRHARS